ncbi:MAG: SRPBCC family protein [Polyangiales bacterium]
MFKKILLVLFLIIGGFSAFVASRPDHYHVERSATMAAPADVVYAQVDDLRAWSAWSPWEKRDPDMKKTYEGPERGVGAVYIWQGNQQVGQGKTTITASTPPNALRMETHFIQPFPSVATSGFDLAPSGDHTKVTWSTDGKVAFMGKFFGLFFNMDSIVGPDFDRGLEGIKNVAEAKATEQKAHDAAAQAAATAQAAAAGQGAQAPAAAAAPAK